MKIEVVAKNYREAANFLRTEKCVTGRALYHKLDTVKIWHGDVIRADSDRGDIRNVYSVMVDDQPVIQNNVRYIA